MNFKNTKLKDWAKGHIHKYLICDNPSNGRTLIRKFNRNDITFSNLSVVRIFDVAKEIVVNNHAKNQLERLKFLDNNEKEIIIDNLLKKNDYSSFIRPASYCDPTTKEVVKIMDIIRSGCLNAKSKLLAEKKIKGIRQLIKDFESEGYYDEISTIIEATKILNSNGYYQEADFAIIESYSEKLTYIEEEFIKALKVEYAIEYKENEKCINKEFYKIYGAFNEVDFILDDIKEKKLNMGDVEILIPSNEYVTTLASAMANRGFPYSICLSYGLRDNSLIMLLLDIIHWASNNYVYTDFKKIIENPLVKMNNVYFENKKMPYMKDTTYNLGKCAGMLYSLDRYKLFVEKIKENKIGYLKLIYKYENNLLGKITDNEDIKNSLTKELDTFVDFVSSLIEVFDKNKKNSGNLLNSILNIKISGKELIKTLEEKNRIEKNPGFEAIKELNKGLKKVSESATTEIALKELETKIMNLSGIDDEDSSKILVKKAGTTNIIERGNIYIIGLSFDSFVPKTTESPLLSDDEIIGVLNGSYYLSLARMRPSESNKCLLDTLDTINKNSKIIITRPFYNTRDLREVPPAPLYKDLLKDYTELRGSEANEKSINNYLHLSCNSMDYSKSFNQDYSELGEGENPELKFVNIEKKGNHTIYSLKEEYRLTASQTDSLLGCRLQYIYGREYFDSEIEIDYSNWLKANQLGILYHNTLEEYCNSELKGKSYKVISDSYDNDKLMNIFNAIVEDYKILYPAPSENMRNIIIVEAEKRIKKYLENLYKDLKTNHYMIYGCEVSIGEFYNDVYKKEKVEDVYISFNMEGGIFDPTTISDDKETKELRVYFKHTSRIDRIDYNEDTKKYRIIDYKSGNAFDKAKMGDKTQWLIYSHYLKNVENFTYVFVRKNDQLSITDPTNHQTYNNSIKTIGKNLVDLFVNGNVTCSCFVDEDNNMTCKYCNYSDICAGKLGLIKEDSKED